MHKSGFLAVIAAYSSIMLTSPAGAYQQGGPVEATLGRMLLGESEIQGKKLEKAVAKADQHPLGGKDNPVRASGPQGQRAYLERLRCADGKTPSYNRAGNVGLGVFGNIVDLYIVQCAGSTPASTEILMDMYHSGYVETRAVPGFVIDSAPPT